MITIDQLSDLYGFVDEFNSVVSVVGVEKNACELRLYINNNDFRNSTRLHVLVDDFRYPTLTFLFVGLHFNIDDNIACFTFRLQKN